MDNSPEQSDTMPDDQIAASVGDISPLGGLGQPVVAGAPRLTCSVSRLPAETLSADIVIYGATPAGITAAFAAAGDGAEAILLQPDRHVGGMVSGGLGATDFGDKRTIGGLSRQFFDRIAKHYGGEYIFFFEPHVASQVFAEMLAEAKITVRLDCHLESAAMKGNRIQAITLADHTRIDGRVFIDASYEGDLMALAGIPYTVGRESREQYNEPLAGIQPIGATTFDEFKRTHPLPEKYVGWTTLMIPTIEFYRQRKGNLNTHQFPAPVSGLDDNGRPLPGVTACDPGQSGGSDKKFMAYNFRLSILFDARRREQGTDHEASKL